ncbi:MAG TPA: hypothetical protein VMC83_38455 [Streptosporangiaceae bacterium]|nr:hypothetical protein [Streptosporangiaceae bacterium]
MLTRALIGSDSFSHGHDASDADVRAPDAEAGPPANASATGSVTATNPAITTSRGERRLARGLLGTLAERNSFIEGLLLAGR